MKLTRGRTVALTVVVLVVALVLLFDWNWLRPPLNRYITQKTHREFNSSDLHVKLGWNPVIRLRDVYFANADWAGDKPMAKIGTLEFSVSIRDLFDGKVLVPRVGLDSAELNFERTKEDKRNWVLTDPSETQKPSRLRISSLSVTKGQLTFVDQGLPFRLGIGVNTFEPEANAKATDAKAAPDNSKYTTRYVFEGAYHDAKFSGNALTGDVLSFQESGVQFPVKGHLSAGTTTLDLEGTVADAAKLSAIDVRMRIKGQTLANLYPFLVLPLPASPPYQLSGHLTMNGNRYGMDEIKGQIGSTDVAGDAAYIEQQPRPLLKTRLHSKLLDMADLGPVVGLTTKDSPDKKPATQAETNTRESAKAKEQVQSGGDKVIPQGTVKEARLLPTGKFEGGRFKAIDAEATLTADKVNVPDQFALQKVRVGLNLKDAVLKLDPFDFDVADGQVISSLVLDARQPTLKAALDIEARKLRLARLVPESPRLAPSRGAVGGRVKLTGTGNSVADAAGNANGEVNAVLSSGQVSNLLDAVAGLNGGKVIGLLMGGDKPISIRCGAASFAVASGQGKSKVFVIDTDQTRIDAGGSFDLANEKFDLTIAPQPKEAGILSLRSPLRVYGSFRHPDYALDKKALAMRGGGAVALALLNPLAALLPLIETGPGEDTDCNQLFAQVKPAMKTIAKP